MVSASDLQALPLSEGDRRLWMTYISSIGGARRDCGAVGEANKSLRTMVRGFGKR